ncbi:MAG: hypothetical protein JO023_22590 [Chloroflexi bacterium]|nr:hypothetical protein [Chloroflexota bacterium]
MVFSAALVLTNVGAGRAQSDQTESDVSASSDTIDPSAIEPQPTEQPAPDVAGAVVRALPTPPPAPSAVGRLSPTDPLNGGDLIANMHGFLFHERQRDWTEDISYAHWLGARVIRTFGTDNIGFRSWDGKHVGSQIVAVAPLLRAQHMKLIVAFVNNHRPVPGEAAESFGWMDNYLQLLLPFYTGNWRNAYLQFVRDLIGTVQSNDAQDVIQAWELGNELHTPRDPSALEPFVTGAVQEVRALDSTTPILPGTMGANHVQPWDRNSAVARWLYCDAPIDAYTLHSYDWVSTDRGGDMPIDWDLNTIIPPPCPNGRRLPVLVEELGTSRSLDGLYDADQESNRFDEELRQINLVRRYPQVVGFGVWDAESPRELDRSFFDIRRGLTSYGANALGGGSCYDPYPATSPGVRCQLEDVLRHVSLLRSGSVLQWLAGPETSGVASVVGSLDPLPDGARADDFATLSLSGWVVDTSAAEGGTGVGSVELYQGAANEHGALLARADTNISRAEPVTISGNPDWGTAGFSLHLPLASVPGGATPLTLAVHTTEHGTWLSTIWLTVPVPDASAPSPDLSPEPEPTPSPRSGPTLGPPPHLVVTAPRSGAMVSGSYVLQGSAYDPSATASQGTGIDRVEAFLEPDRDGGGRLLGDAVLVPSDSSAGSGPQGATYTLPVRVAPGPHTLYVHAHSAITGLETVVTVPFTAI